MPVYTKMVIDRCGDSKGDGTPVAAGYLTAYNCADPDCSQCDENAELVGYATAADLAPIVNVDGCFSWTTTMVSMATNQSSWLDMIQSATKQAQMFVPNATQSESTVYWDIFLDNTCMGAELKNEVVEKEDDDIATSGGNALVPGLFFAIFVIVAIA